MTDPARGERIAIVGARAHPDLDIVRAYVRSLPPGTVVMSGGAEGVDRAAEETAIECGLAVVSYRVIWPHDGWKTFAIDELYRTSRNAETHETKWHRAQRIPLSSVGDSRTALIFRNTLIALADRSVVFPDGSKGGCFDEARQAVRFKRPVELRWRDGKVESYQAYQRWQREG